MFNRMPVMLLYLPRPDDHRFQQQELDPPPKGRHICPLGQASFLEGQLLRAESLTPTLRVGKIKANDIENSRSLLDDQSLEPPTTGNLQWRAPITNRSLLDSRSLEPPMVELLSLANLLLLSNLARLLNLFFGNNIASPLHQWHPVPSIMAKLDCFDVAIQSSRSAPLLQALLQICQELLSSKHCYRAVKSSSPPSIVAELLRAPLLRVG